MNGRSTFNTSKFVQYSILINKILDTAFTTVKVLQKLNSIQKMSA